MRRTGLFSVLAVVLVLALVTAANALGTEPKQQVSAPPAPLALSRTNARNYAESWVSNTSKKRNSNYPDWPSDCTNFASQTIAGGGYAMQFSSPKWYVKKVNKQWDWSYSWSGTGDLANFLVAKGWGTWWGYQTPGTHNIASLADILEYDWTGDGGWDHAAVEVLYSGCDPDSKWCGDLVDQHTTDRYHAFWTLQPYNANWQTTKIGLWHVNY